MVPSLDWLSYTYGTNYTILSARMEARGGPGRLSARLAADRLKQRQHALGQISHPIFRINPVVLHNTEADPATKETHSTISVLTGILIDDG